MTPLLMKVPLDRVTGLAMEPGTHFALEGAMVSNHDGALFDGARLFDLEAGGLRVVTPDSRPAAYVLTWTGETSPVCAAAGAPSPCLVPRIAPLAHERLQTANEFLAGLAGGVELESPAPGTAAEDGHAGAVVAFLVIAVGLAGALWACTRVARRMARDTMRRIRVAARRALRAIQGDATLAPVRSKITALVERARQLEALRQACTSKLRRVDRAALDRKAAVLAIATGPSVSAAMATLAVEREEATRLERELHGATLELDRIESALRVVTLRAGTRDARLGLDPVDALVAELDLREQALLEAGSP